MVQRLEELLNKQVGVIIAVGAKGPIKISGTVIDVNDDTGMISLSVKSGGMIGGKKQKTMVFFAYSILGLEIEGW